MGRYVATLATAVLALGMTTGANAMTVSTPAALGTVIQDIATPEKVHCRPGWVHWHPWGWSTGCPYGYYPYYPSYGSYGFYGGSSFFFGHRHHHHRHHGGHRGGHRGGHHR